MSDNAASVSAYWSATETRDWDAYAALLSPEVVYEMAQTRERVVGREAYVRFNRAYPGDWHLTPDRIHGDATGAASLVDFVVGDETMTGITFFGFDADGLITSVRDFWPEPYEPPTGREDLVQRY
jgi:ketosteroid isomerase-like protein